MRQADIIDKLNDKEIILNVYYTQLLLLVIALISGIFLIGDWEAFYRLFEIDFFELIRYGIGGALIVLMFNGVLILFVPEKYYDDGGVNRRIFSILPYWHIVFLCMIVAFCEEILFRGVIQTAFGLIPASIIFAIVHIRYLYKPLLFAATVLVSFFLGWLFLLTNNLWVTIVAHFLIDAVLGFMIRYQAAKEDRLNE